MQHVVQYITDYFSDFFSDYFTPRVTVPLGRVGMCAVVVAFAATGVARAQSTAADQAVPAPTPSATDAPLVAEAVDETDSGDADDSGEPDDEDATDQSAGGAGAETQPDLAELERRIAVLAEEVELLRSGEEPRVDLTDDQARALGLAPSAATAYERTSGVSIAGYGEMLYENFAAQDQAGRPTGAGSQLDFLRAIVYMGYRFNDKFLFNSEIEFEHADEVSVEFAYIDYLAHENVGFRGGMLLVPMGLVNEFHEPMVFLGAERPVTEQRIIPSTWRENGGGVYGAVGRVTFRAYAINGLDGLGFSANGIRGGRQKGSKAKATNMAFTGRLDVTPTPGVFFGASLYSGGSGQGDVVLAGRDFDVRTTIVEVHTHAQIRGLDVRGLYARATIADAAELNRVAGLSGSAGVAEMMQGGYAQVGYDVLSQVRSPGELSLMPYVRVEKVDTQATMPAGFDRSLATNNTYTTVGVALKPISNIAVKVDHTWVRNDAESAVNQFSLSLGYAF